MKVMGLDLTLNVGGSNKGEKEKEHTHKAEKKQQCFVRAIAFSSVT